MENELNLTPEQEKLLLDAWNKTPDNPPSFPELSKAVFGQEYDGRTVQGRAIKKCLSRHNLRAKVTTTYETKTDKIELTDDQRLYIKNNASAMTPVDITRIVFKNPALTNLNAETKIVADYVKTLDPSVTSATIASADDVPTDDYKAPRTIIHALARVNQYIEYPYDKDKITSKQRKEMEALMRYLSTWRFIKQMNNYETESDRKSCEDAFVRYTYDKPDLSQEDLDQYIILANEVVMSFKAQRRSERLQQMLEAITDNTAENAKIGMSLVEAISKASNEFNQCVNRQQDLLNNLAGKRSAKLSKRMQENSSVLNFLQMWKEEEGRSVLMNLAKIEQEAVAHEVERLADMDEARARILGLTKDEILHG